MCKHLLTSVLLLFSFSTAISQELAVNVNYVLTNGVKDESIIYYSPTKKLYWQDFKGNPESGGNTAAITSSGFGYNIAFRGNSESASLTINVYCHFSKIKSWVKQNRKTDYILSHEQHHFDISYILTKRFIDKVKKINFTIDNYRQQIESLYAQYSKEMYELQHQYDGETNNGQNTVQQEAWNEKIDTELSALTVSKEPL